MDERYQTIETRYGFSLPNEYWQMQSRGWFDVQDQQNYVWLHEAEWLSLDEIAHYEFKPPYQSGFVPFAFNGAGDLWCWWLEAASEGAPIVWCSHDADNGFVIAPHFIGFIYGQMVESCLVGYAPDAPEKRDQLQQWLDRFAEFLPAQWTNNLLELMDKEPLTEAEYEDMVQLAFGNQVAIGKPAICSE